MFLNSKNGFYDFMLQTTFKKNINCIALKVLLKILCNAIQIQTYTNRAVKLPHCTNFNLKTGEIFLMLHLWFLFNQFISKLSKCSLSNSHFSINALLIDFPTVLACLKFHSFHVLFTLSAVNIL